MTPANSASVLADVSVPRLMNFNQTTIRDGEAAR
jgi:hypothetical protein